MEYFRVKESIPTTDSLYHYHIIIANAVFRSFELDRMAIH